MKKTLVLLMVAVLAFALTACNGGGAKKPLTIIMGEGNTMNYNPPKLEVAKGDKIEVTLINKDATQAHSFIITELGVKTTQVQPNQTVKSEISADKAGTFTFYCDVPGHKDSGMKGEITVKG